MFISPMLLQKSSEALSDAELWGELKFDGIRLILSKFNDKVRLFSRRHNEITSKFKELQHINIPNGSVLDGEIIVTSEDGKPDFELMMDRFQSSRSLHDIQYCVFDLLYYKHENLMFKPLWERKRILETMLPTDDKIVYVQHIVGNGKEYFESVREFGLEGIVQKKPNSIYVPGSRSKNWIKVINYQYEKVFIQGIRKDKFGVLLSFEDGSPAGIMEFMKPADRKILYGEYRKYIKSETKDFIFLEPKLKGIVKYRNLTKKGYLRIPSLEGWIA